MSGYPVDVPAAYHADSTRTALPAPGHDLIQLAARYQPVDWEAAWNDQPEDVVWLVEPFLEAGTVNALFAKPGTGKSLLALEIASKLATQGHVVVYIDDENRVADLVERLQAFGHKPADLARLRVYSFAGLPPLDTAEGGEHLLALAAVNAARLVILDTTTRMVAGRENDSDTFLQLYRCSLVPLKARGITVLRLDHPGKDSERGQRGSSAKDGDVDTIWRLEEISPFTFQLERTKSRSGHGASAVALRRRSGPLRTEWSEDCPSILNAEKIAGQLDDLGLPRNAGRPAARKALDAAGVKVANSQLEAAIRYRKNCPGQSAGSSGSGASLTDCPPVPLIGTGSRAAPAPDWPPDETGSCAKCGTPCRRYGPAGAALCPRCQNGSTISKESGPQ